MTPSIETPDRSDATAIRTENLSPVISSSTPTAPNQEKS